MKTLLVCSLVLFSCSASPVSSLTNSGTKQERILEAEPEEKSERKVPIGIQQTKALHKYLLALGIKPVKVGKVSYITAYDLSCHMQGGDNTQCEFFTQPAEVARRKERSVKGQAILGNLRALLQSYPVEQGDPGAISHFAQCRTYSYTDSTDCYLAVHLNYEGP
jgi:hypothetical protein